jgi:ABC-type nickel/cobalt efflux system permease component RcnA
VGATVTATHTAGVLALGLLVSAGTAFVPARVYPWLSVASGVLVVLVGLALLRESARRTTRQHADGSHAHGLLGRPHTHGVAALHDQAHDHDHDHDHSHPHDHDHGTRRALAAVGADGAGVTVPRPATDAVPVPHEPHGEHPHSHSDHLPAHSEHGHTHTAAVSLDDQLPPSRRQLVAMGLAGGLLPSPSALLVLLGAVALGHPWFGVALVVAFGLGMAATLAAVGLIVMRLRVRAEQRLSSHPASRFAPVLRLAPVVTAAVVVVLGLALTWRGVGSTGLV